MTRKELIKEAAQKEMSKYPNFCITAPAFRMGAEWADAHPHWISVEDELPQKNGMYIFLQSGIIYTAMYYKSIGLHRDVTHWMPLPSIEHLKD